MENAGDQSETAVPKIWVIQGDEEMPASKSDTGDLGDRSGRTWPVGVRWVVSIVILFHVAAVLAGAFGADPASTLEHDLVEKFTPYHRLVDQGDSYRYYSSSFPPTPVVTATLTFDHGRPERVVRIPDRTATPRLLYQRQLAMAHYLTEDFEAARHEGDGSQSRWAHAFASYLKKANPGCQSVTLRVETHLVPRIERVLELMRESRGRPVDLDSDEFVTAPERIGVYP